MNQFYDTFTLLPVVLRVSLAAAVHVVAFYQTRFYDLCWALSNDVRCDDENNIWSTVIK